MKKFEQWIQKQIEYYVPILGLTKFDIKIEQSTEEKYLAMRCNYPYLSYVLLYNKAAFEDWKKGKLKPDRILHELCHIVTDPLYIKGIERYSSKVEILDERERLTDTIAMIVQNLL